MAGKGGGAWKVAYADFVTAMMAFFMVMWITAQGKEVKEAVAQYFKDPYGSKAEGGAGTAPRYGDSAKDQQAMMSLRGAGNGLMNPSLKITPAKGPKDGQGKPTVFALHDGDRRMVGTVVAFAEGSAEIGEKAKELLRPLIPLLRGKRNKIEVRGHATRRPLPPGSPFADAWQLSYARCLAVMKILEQEGVEPERIRLAQAGPYEPQTLHVDDRSQALNSRVEVYVLGELAQDLVGTKEERAERFKTP